jgi:RNA polymerase sigma-70 factor (ECF subfamily)
MLPAGDSFADFLTRLRSRDGDAARQVFERFSRRLVGLARKRVADHLRHRVDPEDVVQSAYKSFFVRYGGGELDAAGWDGLWGLLALITLRKCAERAAYHGAQMREVAREAAGAADGPWAEGLSREPTPEEAAELAEVVGQLVESLDADERPVVELSLQGYTTSEISERLGRPERTVRRLRERVRARLEQAPQGGAG